MKKKPNPFNQRIGAMVKELRKDKGLTQEKFSEIMHINGSTMSHYEQGVNPIPLEELAKIADYFHVSVDYLIGRTHSKRDYIEYNKKICGDLKGCDVLNLISKLSPKNQNIIKELLLLMNNNKNT